MPSEELKPTERIPWTGKHEPISVSRSSHLLDKTTFLCDKDLQRVIFVFMANLEMLAEKNNAEMRSKFLEIETNIKSVYTRFSTSLMNDAISKRVKQESTKTNVSRMRKKKTHPLSFSGFKKSI